VQTVACGGGDPPGLTSGIGVRQAAHKMLAELSAADRQEVEK
jgi:hypothetical protein